MLEERRIGVRTGKEGPSAQFKLAFLLGCLLFVFIAVMGCDGQQAASQTKPQGSAGEGGQAALVNTGEQADNTHSKMGLQCEQCHEQGVENPVKQEQCLSCHKGMAEVALLTKEKEPNPHGPHHYDTADCTTCHSIHAKSQMMCSTCHDFPWINELDEELWTKL